MCVQNNMCVLDEAGVSIPTRIHSPWQAALSFTHQISAVLQFNNDLGPLKDLLFIENPVFGLTITG